MVGQLMEQVQSLKLERVRAPIKTTEVRAT